MKAMLWKEWRENLRWAVLGCLVVTLADFYVLSGEQRGFQSNSDITLTDPTFLMVVLFGSALVAAGLAALQILPERNRDRWAALLHRPVSRSMILGGKAVAGLSLYGAAVLLPFLACVGYVAWPGNFSAPFVPGLLLPGLHAMAGGIAFYFASLLLCLYRGRWLGTRGVLLLAVAAVFLLQMGTRGVFLLFPALAAVVLALAAWHTILGHDSIERGHWLRRVAFVIVILLGTQMGLLLVGAGLILLPRPGSNPAPTYTRLQVTQEGQVFRSRSSADGEGQVMTDLAGHTITDERYVGNNSYQNFCQFWPLSYMLGSHRGGAMILKGSALEGSSHVQEVRLGSQAKENWFYLVQRDYFIGYDLLSRRCIGICDREGFKSPAAAPVPFLLPLQSSFYSGGAKTWYWSNERLYAINFFDRQFGPFYDCPDGTLEEVMQVPLGRSSEEVRYVMLALQDRMEVLDDAGRPVFTRPYLHDPRKWSSVEVATNLAVDRFYLLSQPAVVRAEGESTPTLTYLDELDLHGEQVHSYQEVIDNTSLEARWLTIAQASLFPILPAGLEHLYNRMMSTPPNEATLFYGLDTLDRDGWITMAALAVALAALAFIWARRSGRTIARAWSWAAFALTFGPAGLLALRWAVEWPQRVRCPACGHLRSLDRETCAHCHRAWETPQPTGTEIFQEMPA